MWKKYGKNNHGQGYTGKKTIWEDEERQERRT